MVGVPGENMILLSVQPCINNPIWSRCLPGAQNLVEFHIILSESVDFCEKDARFQKGPSFFRILRKWRTLPKGRIYRFSQEFIEFPRKTHIFSKSASFLRILRKWRTFPKGRICRFPKNSQTFHEKHRKRMSCLRILRKWRTLTMGRICRIYQNVQMSMY